MYVLDEALAAVKAARDLGLFCFASMTYDSTPQGFRTMLGTSVEEATRALDAAGADVVGTNCGNGILQIGEIVRRMRPLTKKPLLARANAGLPERDGTRLVYHDGPEFMASRVRDLRQAGAAIIGGCCGTTPEHIRAFRAAIDALEH
jgi:methionine synthase I (cobalamin-dependent)